MLFSLSSCNDLLGLKGAKDCGNERMQASWINCGYLARHFKQTVECAIVFSGFRFASE